MQADERKRLRILSVFIFLVALFFVGRLYVLQVLRHDDFRAEAEKQYVATLPNLFNRGSIYFHEKDGRLVAAATINSGFVIAITPKDIPDAEKTYRDISAITPIDHDEFITKAKKLDDPYEEVAQRVSEDAATKLRALGIPGVQIFRQTWRYYPGGSLAAQKKIFM